METLTAEQKLAEDHWWYLLGVLQREIPEDITYSKQEYLDNVGRHYVEAMVHGIKHGEEKYGS